MAIQVLSDLLICKNEISTFQNRRIEILLFQLFDQFILGLQILNELDFDFIHFIDLWSPLVELLGENINDAIATYMTSMFLHALITQEAVVLDAEMCSILFGMKAQAEVGVACSLYLVIVEVALWVHMFLFVLKKIN